MIQTDGFGHLKKSCPSVVIDLLKCAATNCRPVQNYGLGNEATADGADEAGRRVKQRLL